MIQINCNVKGNNRGDSPILVVDTGNVYPGYFENNNRCIFKTARVEPSPYGGHIEYDGRKKFAYLSIPSDGFVGEATDLAVNMRPAVLEYEAVISRIHIEGTDFIDESGQKFIFEMTSGFRDFDRYSHGEDITPILQQAADLGANGRRVFFAVNSFGNLKTIDYSKVSDFLDLLADHGLYCEMTNGDLQRLSLDQYTHFSTLLEIVRTKKNVFFEFCNENDNNGLDVAAALRTNRDGVICSLGSSTSGGQCPLPSLDYAGSHIQRTLTAGMYGDTCPMYMQNGYSGYLGVGKKPVPHNEIIGGAEYAQAGRRTNDPKVAYALARMSTPWNGMTYHCELGIDSQLLSGKQLECGIAFFEGMK